MTDAEMSAIMHRFTRTPKHELAINFLTTEWAVALTKVDRAKTPNAQPSQCVEIMQGEVRTWAEASALAPFSVCQSECIHSRHKHAGKESNQDVGNGRMSAVGVNRTICEKGTCSDCGAGCFDEFLIHGA